MNNLLTFLEASVLDELSIDHAHFVLSETIIFPEPELGLFAYAIEQNNHPNLFKAWMVFTISTAVAMAVLIGLSFAGRL